MEIKYDLYTASYYCFISSKYKEFEITALNGSQALTRAKAHLNEQRLKFHELRVILK